jgi:hypothetical protein
MGCAEQDLFVGIGKSAAQDIAAGTIEPVAF